MNIRVKSPAIRYLERITGGPLTFARLMESMRLCEEMSQSAFAKLLGISKSHLCDIEKGRKSVSPKRAAYFARKLGYSEQQFVKLAMDAMLEQDGLKYKVELIAA
ncbi:MAG: helix-turn-helix transcriptional regulator [Pseudomonadota bacterium]